MNPVEQEMSEIMEEKKNMLKQISEKCELQNKKIKLFRKQNEDIKLGLSRQTQNDTILLLNSKELLDANSKMQFTIKELSAKIEASFLQVQEQQVLAVGKAQENIEVIVTIEDVIITENTKEIDLPSKAITDHDILRIKHFAQLQSLLLGENKIGNEGVQIICKHLRQVQKIQLNNNIFSSEGLSQICNLKQLKVLDVRGNNLGNDCLRHIGQLQQLTELSISKNKITDEGLESITTLQKLTYLDMTNNQITDQGVTPLCSLNKLVYLYLMSNLLTQTGILLILQLLPALEALDVRFNINDPKIKEQLKLKKPEKMQFFC